MDKIMTSLGTKLYSLLSLIKIHEYRGLCTTLPDYSEADVYPNEF